ncbi:PucR family transcriptional regulator [Aminipila butyrica]|uniref:PucR family transcriptional regulator n=1 Tax=Aminipila butyrica TaxID=433296 RepID=A0A858BVL1_9FIRM|nr:PucR family transcriptional regulator [Aminipila butyrica]QIB68116.1 PucR family transcriptional regulator [Aminipila butyrica]
MYISLKEILKNNMFKGATVLAGEPGTDREVKRVMVFDYPANSEILDRNILTSGDFFITDLHQFKEDAEGIYDYIHALIDTGSSGLLIVTDENIRVVTEDVLKICDDSNFPLIFMKEDPSYAGIMDTINQYISIENLNVINNLKLDKIMYGNISEEEKLDILYSIKPDVQQYVRTIYVDGTFRSEMDELKTHGAYLNNTQDIYLRNKSYKIFILSAGKLKQLQEHSDWTAEQLRNAIDKPKVGFSRIYPKEEIGIALEEGRRSLETAKTMNIDFRIYNPLSVMQLLVSLKDTKEAQDFYEAYINAVKDKVSSENAREVLLTMETYVANAGDYKATAKVMNQHENTIRYRVNKVKYALDMENDDIKFKETIALAVKLRILMDKALD